MKRRSFIFWPAILCLVVWVSSLQSNQAFAYRDDGSTAEPNSEATETPLPETVIPTITDTPQLAPIPESATAEGNVKPAHSVQSPTPSVIPTNSATPQPTAIPPVAALPGEYVADEALVRFRKSASEENITQCLSFADATTISIIEELGIWVVNIPYGKVAESIAIISTCPEVRYVEPNYMASAADTIPSDPFWNWQYGLSNIHAFQGWDYSTGSTAVTIAIVDSGVDLDHPDLSSKIVTGYNAFNDSSNANDDHFQSHGTHVAGIAAATSNNGIGVTGVSWGARIMPVKVLNSFGLGPLSIVVKGIVWATNHGAQVINFSLGFTSDSPTLQDAINYASGHGVVLVAAAGNDTATANLRYPAQYPNVIAVGAVDSGNNRTASSNYGPELDLVAPGQLIYSTITGSYGYLSGTSMAAPYVSGLAAVLYGMPGNGSSALVTTQMESSAADLGLPGFDNEYGFGLIQMDRALMLVPMPARTISPAGAGGGNLFSNPGVATFAPGPTNTSTNTPTASPSVTSLPNTASPTASTTPTIQTSPTPEKQQARKRNLPEWQLPCAGLIFILAGLLLIWAMRGKRGRKF